MSPSSALLARALADHRAGRLTAAEAGYRQVLAAQPEDPVARHHLGLVLFTSGRQAAAWPLLQGSCTTDAPADYFLNVANLLWQAQRPEAAIALLQDGLRAHPGQAELSLRAGEMLLTQGRADTAAELAAAACLSPCPATVAHNLAALLYRSGNDRAALAASEQALRQGPTPAALNLKAALLRRGGDCSSALTLVEQALALRPGDPESLRNRAALLRDLQQLPQALAASEQALQADRHSATAWNTCGTVLLDLRQLADAEFCFRQALTVEPKHPAAHFNLGLTRLTLGDWREGFAEYEWRTRQEGVAGVYPDFGLPRWDGRAAPGQTLLLVAEQGHGDTLQFIRLARHLKERVGQVVLLAQPALVRLLAPLPWLDVVLPLHGPETPQADWVLPLLSLPAVLGLTPENLPQMAAQPPFLNISTVDREFWQKRLAALPQPRVGLVWAGDPRPNDPASNRIDTRRSLHFSQLQPLLAAHPHIAFVSLQKGSACAQLPAGLTKHPGVTDWSDEFTDFARTAALVEQLDLVISVDTAVAHLAGALARPTWILSRFDACWRWLNQRSDSPWYPQMRLFHQAQSGEWAPVLAQVSDELERWRQDYRAPAAATPQGAS
ncbi:tetratricopeptide repeat protein [Dechloromonas sp. ZY10]|uniref:tetratricopeptide repeat protein n=1 Tax=Dechloromonas aquae TaxID=2664436 RepID=UPI003528F2F8